MAKLVLSSILFSLLSIGAQAANDEGFDFQSDVASTSWVCTGYGLNTSGRNQWSTATGQRQKTEAAARQSAIEACHERQLNYCRIACYEE